MNAIAQRARAAALSCEAKKHAYRQTQDGVVVSFVLHPQEVPDRLAIAPLGTRYSLVVVEIGDDEKPVAGAATATARHLKPHGNEDGSRNPGGGNVTQPDVNTCEEAAGPDEPALGRPRKSWDEMSPAQQAGMLCADKSFQKFLRETENDAFQTCNEDYAAVVRYLCDVDSRRDIILGGRSGELWTELVGHYRAWQREPEVVG